MDQRVHGMLENQDTLAVVPGSVAAPFGFLNLSLSFTHHPHPVLLTGPEFPRPARLGLGGDQGLWFPVPLPLWAVT